MKFNIGDEVKVLSYDIGTRQRIVSHVSVGKIFTIEKININSGWPYCVENGYTYSEDQLELAEKQNNSANKTMSTLKDIYLSLTVGEPQKSRQKAGIVDSDNLPTDEGLKMMVKFLMEHSANVTEFDEKVVRPIVEAMEKECKK